MSLHRWFYVPKCLLVVRGFFSQRDRMAFAGFPAVGDQLLEQILPHVGAIAAGAQIGDTTVESGLRRSQMILNEVGHCATAPEGAAAELKKHELLNAKLNRDGAC